MCRFLFLAVLAAGCQNVDEPSCFEVTQTFKTMNRVAERAVDTPGISDLDQWNRTLRVAFDGKTNYNHVLSDEHRILFGWKSTNPRRLDVDFVVVTSSGPDGKFGTLDDLSVRKPCKFTLIKVDIPTGETRTILSVRVSP